MSDRGAMWIGVCDCLAGCAAQTKRERRSIVLQRVRRRGRRPVRSVAAESRFVESVRHGAHCIAQRIARMRLSQRHRRGYHGSDHDRECDCAFHEKNRRMSVHSRRMERYNGRNSPDPINERVKEPYMIRMNWVPTCLAVSAAALTLGCSAFQSTGITNPRLLAQQETTNQMIMARNGFDVTTSSDPKTEFLVEFQGIVTIATFDRIHDHVKEHVVRAIATQGNVPTMVHETLLVFRGEDITDTTVADIRDTTGDRVRC